MIRAARADDLDALAAMMHALWPDGSVDEHRDEAGDKLARLFVADEGGRAVGFAEVGLRSHAEGCDTRHSVGFLEGWYVEPAARRRGIGRALVAAAEDWARAHGCREFASDTWLANEASQRAHVALGFEEVERIVCYRKSLA